MFNHVIHKYSTFYNTNYKMTPPPLPSDAAAVKHKRDVTLGVVLGLGL